MDILTENITNNLDEKIEEINHLNRIINRENFRNVNSYNLLSQYYPSIFYSILEGFFKDSIREYFLFLNRNNLIIGDIDLLTNVINHNDILKESYVHYNSKKNLLKKIKETFDKPLFENKRPHIDFSERKKLNKYLKRIHLNEIDKNYDDKLNKLVMVRHKCVHGDNPLPNQINDLEEYSNLVISLMKLLEDNIINTCIKLLN